MFKSDLIRMTWQMKDGDKVEAGGYLDIYEGKSVYQLKVRTVRKAGAGKQHEELLKLIEKLSEMGMFAPEYKRPIPKYSFRIGVVTSPTGSVIHDIRQVAERRNPGVEIILSPATVQGESAAASIIAGIENLEKSGVDVIIIGRGGGSDEDLSAFNDEALANVIFNCSIPVVSAVGHGDDLSIADMVADAYAPTPSAAAEITVFLFEDYVKDVENRMMSVNRLMQKHLDRKKNDTAQRGLRLEALSPSAKIKMQRMAYMNRADRLDAIMRKRLDDTRSKILIYVEKYKALSPVERIAHGFAAVTDASGKKITTVTTVRAGDKLNLTLKDGHIEATATAVEKRK